MIANIEDGGITLTDAPNVVDLKREFRSLDAQEEELKHSASACAASLHHELARVRARKAEIAREIFASAERPSAECGVRSAEQSKPNL